MISVIYLAYLRCDNTWVVCFISLLIYIFKFIHTIDKKVILF